MEPNFDGSMKGRTFSGPDYKGEYPTPRHGKETYEHFYLRVCKCVEEGYHLGDMSWYNMRTYWYGSPEGGGQYVQNDIIGYGNFVEEETNNDDADDY